MAAGGTARVLGKISAGHLECIICFNRYREPKLLDCLHTFCLICLQELRKPQGTRKTPIKCPVCRRETMIEDVGDLPNNFTTSALVDEFTMQEQLLDGHVSEIKCQSCDDGNIAVSRCVTCDQYICQECQKAHERLTLTRTHTIYTLAQLQSGEVTYKSNLREYVPKCGKHPDKSLSIYCNTCQQLTCTTCFILDHNKHNGIGLPKALEKCKQAVADLAGQVKNNTTKIRASISEVDKTHKKLDTRYEDTISKISKKADKEVARISKEIAKIRVEEKKMKQEARKVYQDRIKRVETAQAINNENITQTEQKMDALNQLMSQASCSEMLDLKPKLLHNLKELTEKQPEKVTDTLSFMDFEEGEEKSLGRLVLEDEEQDGKAVSTEGSPRLGRWELKKKVKKFQSYQKPFRGAYKVAAFSNNEILVIHVDTNHRQVISILFKNNPQTSVLSKELKLPGLTKPTHVLVNKNDQLIILDSPQVKIFSREYVPIHQFIPARSINENPSCLAVDDNNVIAVGYEGRDMIFLHNPDGSLIKQVLASMIGNNLTISKHNLIYMNRHHQLLSIDYNGQKVFSVDIPSSFNIPWVITSVGCDSHGGIYVCIGFPGQGEVHHFSPDGKYIGCVIKECGDPYDITFTPAGDLVIAARNSVQIYSQV